MSNSNKTNKVFNSSIRKYLNLNIEKPSIAKQNMEFSHFQKTPLKIHPLPCKNENCSPMRTPNIKLETFSIAAAQNKTDVTFSGISKMSYDSQTEEINFDHCQYIEIMQNLQKGQIKLYSNSKNPSKKKSIKLMDFQKYHGSLKKDISDFGGFLTHNKLSLQCSKKYECKYCGAAFNKPCALGGHMSKMHKGRSRFFKKRKEKREMRETERQRNTFFKNIFKQNC